MKQMYYKVARMITMMSVIYTLLCDFMKKTNQPTTLNPHLLSLSVTQ